MRQRDAPRLGRLERRLQVRDLRAQAFDFGRLGATHGDCEENVFHAPRGQPGDRGEQRGSEAVSRPGTELGGLCGQRSENKSDRKGYPRIFLACFFRQ
jgi:hypothetical protein